MHHTELQEALKCEGFEFTWPGPWAEIAAALAEGVVLPPAPSSYDTTLLRELHQQNSRLALAVVRRSGGWTEAPHNDADFYDVLKLWDDGHPEAEPGDEGHFVAARLGGKGRHATRIDVARCKDCGIPVFATGLTYRIRRNPANELSGWRRIWPAQSS